MRYKQAVLLILVFSILAIGTLAVGERYSLRGKVNQLSYVDYSPLPVYTIAGDLNMYISLQNGFQASGYIIARGLTEDGDTRFIASFPHGWEELISNNATVIRYSNLARITYKGSGKVFIYHDVPIIVTYHKDTKQVDISSLKFGFKGINVKLL